eukprot:CAMPEP_0184690312 /NCGR_PEP_ID=MMETSP0312-20130426/31154_1 /TAXON_ID=31354 /ORGANISM="Compsopogon coeruleus, Strain SAG 36.94" /LENGTH=128 /DNA_ID=CAMNT_0027147783 /DNA_START=137 /DNA_END=523 /DNA_ORIENTATION=+
MAFVSTSLGLAHLGNGKAGAVHKAASRGQKLATRRSGAASLKAVAPNSENKNVNGDGEPINGWTAVNERLNGRLAMMGFLIAILTEALGPNHPSVLQQLSVFVPPPVANFFVDPTVAQFIIFDWLKKF